MKLATKLGSLAVVVAAIGSISMNMPQEAKNKELKPGPLSPQFDAAGMKLYEEVCHADFHHDKLADWIGTWDTESKMWMMGPGSAPTVTKGTAVFSWQIDRKWLKQETTGELMGRPLKGFGLLGYDRYKKKYVGTWVDSMTTNKLDYEGNFDAGDKNLVLYGRMDEPMSGEHDKAVRYVWRFVDKDKFVFEVHDLSIGEENTRVFEIDYTRRKN